jgi:hypothetical protein
MRSMQCNVELGYQLNICSETKENHGKPCSSWTGVLRVLRFQLSLYGLSTYRMGNTASNSSPNTTFMYSLPRKCVCINTWHLLLPAGEL